MASRIILPFWPSSLDCLTWSSDNIIAVGGGDQIGIITPLLRGTAPNNSHWTSTTFKANAFTASEVPQLIPLTFENFSVGEELSLQHVHSLDWSPPGLGKFRHCVLAVLSANHVLSIWECEGKPEISGNWRRKVVVNHALVPHYAGLGRRKGETAQQYQERKQVSQRIRAFAWSKPISTRTEDDRTSNIAISEDGGCCLMTLSTEAGDILVLRIRAPYDILIPEVKDWEVDIIHSLKLTDLLLKGEVDDSPLTNNYESSKCKNIIADHLAFGPWYAKDGGTSCATMALIASGRLFAFKIEAEFANTSRKITLASKEAPQNLLPSRSDLRGPLKFISRSECITAFAEDTVFCIDMSSNSSKESKITSHHLDDRWDEISGVAFRYTGSDRPEINITSHLSSSTASTTALSTPLDQDAVSQFPAWQAAIGESKTAFSTQHGLNGFVQDRTWGIAASPWGDYVATAVTLLPSDCVAHIIPSDCRTVLNITRETLNTGGSNLSRVARNSSSEVMVFGLQRHLEQFPDDFDSQMWSQSVQPGSPHPETRHETEDLLMNPSSSAYALARELRAQVFQADMLEARRNYLANMALNRNEDRGQPLRRLIQHLVLAVVKITSHVQPGGDLSDRISKLYRGLYSKLHPHPELNMVQADNNISGSSEVCRICQSNIPFESVKWAQCGGKHQFARCALTFLAIQEPGVSKKCGVCEVQVLTEWKLLEFASPGTESDLEMRDLPTENTDGDGPSIDDQDQEEATGTGWVQISHKKKFSIEPPSSLARVLFAAFDTCIYCGGKFVA